MDPMMPHHPAYGPAGPALVGPLLPGAVAGVRASRAWQKALGAARRQSRPRYVGDTGGYGGSYDRLGRYRRTYSRRGGAQVGVGAGSRLLGHLGQAVRASVLWGTVVSTIGNGLAWADRRITGAQAGANVVGDALAAAVGGAAAGVTSAVGTALLGGLLGSGLAMTLAAIALGVLGFAVGDAWIRGTRFFQEVQAGVLRLLG